MADGRRIVTRTTVHSTDVRDVIEGQSVVARDIARDQRSNLNGGMTANFNTVDEVILADDRILFQCNYPDTTCNDYAKTAKAIISHQRAHSPRLRAARLARENEELQRKRAESAARRSEGAKRGHLVREARRAAVSESDPAVYLTDLSQRLTEQAGYLLVIAKLFKQQQTEMTRLSAAPRTSATPEEVATWKDKAERYDAMRRALGQS